MKKPEYKIGDYVEFNKFEEKLRGFIRSVVESYGLYYHVSTRGGDICAVYEKDIIRKLPILRDSRGRFSKKKLSVSIKNYQMVNGKPKLIQSSGDCTCFNCEKCVEQMRAYYEKTGELKPKMGKNWGKIKDAEGNFHEFGEQKPYDEFGSRVYITDAAGNIPTINGDITYGNKKPSERISELFKKNRVTGSSDELAWCRAIGDYLDEQFEKGKK